MANIARDGSLKRTQTTFVSEQTHTALPASAGSPGLLAKGVSRTESARLLGNDQIGTVHGGGEMTAVNLKEGHRGTPPKVHPSMISERQREAVMNGPDILSQAVLSGSTKLPVQTSEEDCPAEPALKP